MGCRIQLLCFIAVCCAGCQNNAKEQEKPKKTNPSASTSGTPTDPAKDEPRQPRGGNSPNQPTLRPTDGPMSGDGFKEDPSKPKAPISTSESAARFERGTLPDSPWVKFVLGEGAQFGPSEILKPCSNFPSSERGMISIETRPFFNEGTIYQVDSCYQKAFFGAFNVSLGRMNTSLLKMRDDERWRNLKALHVAGVVFPSRSEGKGFHIVSPIAYVASTGDVVFDCWWGRQGYDVSMTGDSGAETSTTLDALKSTPVCAPSAGRAYEACTPDLLGKDGARGSDAVNRVRLSVTGEGGRIKLHAQCGEQSVEGLMSVIRP